MKAVVIAEPQAPEFLLYDLARRVMAEAPAQIAREFVAAFPEHPTLDAEPGPTGIEGITLPVAAASDPAACRALTEAFRRHHAGLSWASAQSWEEGERPGIGAWLPIASPTGPIRVEDKLLAFTVLNPLAYYSLHCHGPEEIYVTVAGGFWLTRSAADARPDGEWIAPGETAFNESFAPHALRGGHAPTLMIACWRGGGFERSRNLE